MKQEISLVRLGAGVPEVWYEVNMCGEFSKEREPGTKRVRTVLIRTVSDNIKLRYNLRSAPRHAYSYYHRLVSDLVLTAHIHVPV